MSYYKILKDGYIISIAKGDSSRGIKITEKEYNDILSALKNAPTPPTDCICKLKYNLEWEFIETEKTNEPTNTISDRVSRLEEQTNTNSNEITSLQEALCEVYETII